MSDDQSPKILRYGTPDGALTFLIVWESSDVSLGFDGYSSHTHGDILASLTGQSIDTAVEGRGVDRAYNT